MKKYRYSGSTKKNRLSKRISIDKVKSYNSNNTEKKLGYEYPNQKVFSTNVATKMAKPVALHKVKVVKRDYYESYKKALSVIGDGGKINWQWFRKRLPKFAVFVLLIIAVVTGAVFAVEKAVTLVIDGVEVTQNTSQISASLYGDSVAKDHNLDEYKVKASEGMIKDNTKIEIRSKKDLDLIVRGEKRKVETYSNTLDELFNEMKPELEKYGGKYSFYARDYDGKYNETLLKDTNNIKIDYLSRRVWEKTITSKYKTKYVDNDKLESGTLKVKQKGKDYKFVRKKEIIYLNDKRYQTKYSVSKIIQKGATRIIERGTKVAPGGGVWDRLAKCETGGRWHLNSGNGFYGGLQFSAPTWRTAASKVGVSAPYAHLASKEEQIRAATWLQKNSGWGQWPACSAKLGLR